MFELVFEVVLNVRTTHSVSISKTYCVTDSNYGYYISLLLKVLTVFGKTKNLDFISN